ncbi:MAG: hypothetical protein AAFU85_25930 [Planctomycetota bacterium]
MMKGKRHGLLFQLLLVLKLFVACIVAAGCLVFYRGWVEGFMDEDYQSPPQSLQATIDAVKLRQPIQKAYDEVPKEDRVYLYDYWMATEPINSQLPGELLRLDPNVFLARAERTLVSGSPEQRVKALRFFELGDHPGAIAVLEKAEAWARRRKLQELAGQIEAVLDQLKPQQ